jgi:hypothetical protein
MKVVGVVVTMEVVIRLILSAVVLVIGALKW